MPSSSGTAPHPPAEGFAALTRLPVSTCPLHLLTRNCQPGRNARFVHTRPAGLAPPRFCLCLFSTLLSFWPPASRFTTRACCAGCWLRECNLAAASSFTFFLKGRRTRATWSLMAIGNCCIRAIGSDSHRTSVCLSSAFSSPLWMMHLCEEMRVRVGHAQLSTRYPHGVRVNSWRFIFAQLPQ